MLAAAAAEVIMMVLAVVVVLGLETEQGVAEEAGSLRWRDGGKGVSATTTFSTTATTQTI